MPRKTNITVNGSNYYRVTATVGKNPNGTAIRKQFYGASKREAEHKRDEYIMGLKAGLQVGFDKTIFGTAFRHWLEDIHNPALRHSTRASYEQLHRLYIADSSLSAMKLADISPENVQIYVNELTKITTVSNVHKTIKLLKTFINYCLEVDAIIKSPMRGVKLPKKPEKSDKNTALNEADIEKLIAACEDNIKYFPFLFIIFTGLRSGELRALTFADIDLQEGMVNVNKQVNYLTVDGEHIPIVSPPKTKAGSRRVPILPEIRPLLKTYMNSLTHDGKVLAIDDTARLLFPSPTGKYQKRSNFVKSYRRLCGILDIKKGCTIHSLRHTYCTILARSGVSLLDASRLMGHENINVTAKIYSHVTDEDKKAAVGKLASYFK